MILFDSDWNDFPDAIVHQKTTNKSFLKLAEIYYRMGIKNCDFHLSLLDPRLEFIDPHDPNLSPFFKQLILDECINNFWYFIREVIRVPLPGSLDGTSFRANRSNIALFWLYFNHITTINTVIRQTGKTTNLVSLTQWLLNFGTMGSDIGLVTKDATLKQETMGDIKKQFEYLPDYLNNKVKKDIFNTDTITLSSLENTLTAMLSNASEKEADKVGRGLTLSTLLFDEAAFIKNVSIAMSSATMSGNAARTVAHEAGLPYGTLMTTTAGDIDSRDGNYIYKLLGVATMYNEYLLDCVDTVDLEETILKNSSARDEQDRKPIVNLTMSYRQMGYSEDWMKRKLKETTSTDENIERDLFNKWISGSSTSPLSAEDKERLEESKVEEPRIEIYDPFGYVLKWYISKEELAYRLRNGMHMVIGSDTSDLAGKDDTSFYIRDSQTGEILCGALFNETSIFTLADFIVDFLIKYKQSTLIMERRSTGSSMIDIVVSKLCAEGINPFTRIFNTIFQDKERYAEEYKEIIGARLSSDQVFMKYKTHLGFATSGSGMASRKSLFGSTMSQALKFTAHTTRDIALVSQFMGLQIRNGRIDHAEGGHDDAVVGSLLAYWFISMGRNLNLYGVDISSLMRKNDKYIADRYRGDSDDYERAILEEKENRIEALIEKMKFVTNPIILEQLENQIRYLHTDIKRDTNQASIEEIQESIRNMRKVRQRAM